MDSSTLRLITRFNRIHNLYGSVKKSLTIDCSGIELYPAEMHVLIAVASNPDCSVSELSEMLSITRSAASQLIKKTTAKGLLIKKRDVENERSVHLSITDEGMNAVREFTEREESLFGEFLGQMQAWPDGDIKAVDQFLSMLEEMFIRKIGN